MDWEPYNYSSAFEEPQRIRDIGGYFRLPFAIVLVDLVIFLLSLGIVHWFLGGVINWLANIYSPMKLVCYLLLPYYMVTIINRIRPDGKKIYYYLWDLAVFQVTVKLPEKVFFAGKSLSQKEKNECIRF